ncbi:toxin-antitoxin system YwqK family antitoxin [Sphingobacterium cellulitidis]|uniref:toxin-antitoxin system YwqK family antitoxin n=1 Tax=Sphingobacterium cellulitidis TaxID=1768011 RepID=UPI000B942E9A
MRLVFSIIIICITFLNGSAQESKPVYFENTGNDLVRFYFDSNYYLVDKNCEYKSIERVASFDASSSKFIGSFTDFDLNGHPILEGNYIDGKKSGIFKAYHPNGSLKWESTFVDNKPQGEWRYYYPDGQLMMLVDFGTDYIKVMEFIDTRGRKLVENGNGRFDFKVPFQGYNPYGFPFVKQKGQLKDGVPDGVWQIYYEADKVRDLVAEEVYYRGIFKSGYDLINDYEYQSPVFSILPIENFFRAEKFISKGCNYDEIAGYNAYLSDYLTNSFESFETVAPFEQEFEYTVQVSKDGNPSKLHVTQDLPYELSRTFGLVLKGVERYIPSFVNAEYIQDEVTVNGKVNSNAEGKLIFHSLKISRKNEQ